MDVPNADFPWADLLGQSLRDAAALTSSDPAFILSGPRRPIDPEKLAYLLRLIELIHDGRRIVFWYNYVLLSLLAVFTVLHWGQKLHYTRRWNKLTRSVAAKAAGDEDSGLFSGGQRNEDDDVSHNQPSFSSSSTLQGTQSPGYGVKGDEVDVERQPLLGFRGPSSEPLGHRVLDTIKAWLIYQPRPMPFINRALPSNGTSLFVLWFLGINLFFQLFQHPWQSRYFFAFADRAGYIFIVNLPLLYLLAAKNQPLKFLTGYSYEALNIFHRRVGELLCFEAFVHFAGMIIWELWLTPEWLARGGLWHFMASRLVLLGMGAFIAYELLFFTSLGSFRERWYELFLASHVFLQVAALVFLYLHFHTAKPYVAAALAIFLADRLVWRIGLKSASFKGDVQILEDGETLLLSTNWDIPRQRARKMLGWARQSVLHGWHPMDHVFVTVPSLGRIHALQAHPFTIASAAPIAAAVSDDPPAHAWLSLLIRAQSGFTRDLLKYSQSHSSISVRFDGPYGSTEAIEMLRVCDSVVLIAGGSGIAVVFPLIWNLVHHHTSTQRRQGLHLLWVTHSRAHRSWLPQERLDELADVGVRITIPEPTTEAGRPDIESYVADLTEQASGRETGVVVSGPDGMNRSARNACARAVGRGARVRLRVEKFGW